MTQLTREEEVWVRAFSAFITAAGRIEDGPGIADRALRDFQSRFPAPEVSPPETEVDYSAEDAFLELQRLEGWAQRTEKDARES